MFDYKEILKLLLIVIVIGLPPYLVALKAFRERDLLIKTILSIIYWVGTFYTQQVIPFILILLLLVANYKKKIYLEEYKTRTIDGEKFNFKDFITIGGITILLRFPIGIINIFYVLIIDLFGIKIESQEVINIFVNSQSKVISILIMLLVIIVAPINEEFSMRYWIFGRVLSPRTGIIIAGIISSTLFTLLHYNIAGVPTFFILGLYACYAYHKKGFWGAVTVHFIFNLSSVFFLLLAKSMLPLA